MKDIMCIFKIFVYKIRNPYLVLGLKMLNYVATHAHAITVNVRPKRNDGQYGARTHDIRVISTTL